MAQMQNVASKISQKIVLASRNCN